MCKQYKIHESFPNNHGSCHIFQLLPLLPISPDECTDGPSTKPEAIQSAHPMSSQHFPFNEEPQEGPQDVRGNGQLHVPNIF